MKHLSVLRFLTAAIATAAVGSMPSTALAGTIIVETTVNRPIRTTASGPLFVPADDLFCRYEPALGTSRLGQNTAFTLLEVQGNSTFRYEQFPSVSPIAELPRRTIRSITFRNTSAEQARRLLANRPNDYANLLGLPTTSPIVRDGFRVVDRQFACQPYNDVITAAIAQPPSSNFRLAGPRVDTSLAALPNGNYRVISPSGLNNNFSELAQPGDSALFTFRKFGNSIVGNFEYANSDLAACVSGTVEGNTIVGDAVTSSLGTNVLGQPYLGPSLSLRLGEFTAGDRYTDSVLDLNGFSRINAGTTAPPRACTFR